MKTKIVLHISFGLMGIMIVMGILFPDILREWMLKASIYHHVLFIHIVTTTMFFAYAVVGMLWEYRSLLARNNAIVLHTYNTVTWLDAHLSPLLIIFGVLSGIMLSFHFGNIWETGWFSLSFVLFLFSGVVWVISDIPSQYKIKEEMAKLDPHAAELPPELYRLLKRRVWISLAGVVPLFIVFALMVYKPSLPPLFHWLR